MWHDHCHCTKQKRFCHEQYLVCTGEYTKKTTLFNCVWDGFNFRWRDWTLVCKREDGALFFCLCMCITQCFCTCSSLILLLTFVELFVCTMKALFWRQTKAQLMYVCMLYICTFLSDYQWRKYLSWLDRSGIILIFIWTFSVKTERRWTKMLIVFKNMLHVTSILIFSIDFLFTYSHIQMRSHCVET